MGLIEKISMTMLALILLYLVANNAASVNNTLNAIGSVWNNQLLALQGNNPK